jgi:membrane-associated phospholipid phosphatase
MTTEGAPKRPTLYTRWLSPEGYLGLHLIAGFAIALTAGFAFDLIEDRVFNSPATTALDAWGQQVAHATATPALTEFMRAASWVGNPPTIAALTAVVAALLYFYAHSKRRLIAFLAAMGGGSLLNVLLKNYYQRPRPSLYEPLASVHGFSFPSGHSMGSMLFFASLAYVVYFTIESRRRWRVAVVVLCFVAVFVIGTSRVYLGVHYLSDVVAGFVAGLGWIGVCVTGTEGWVRWRDWRKTKRPTNDTNLHEGS